MSDAFASSSRASTVASISGKGGASLAHPASTKTTAIASKVLLWGNSSIPFARREGFVFRLVPIREPTGPHFFELFIMATRRYAIG